MIRPAVAALVVMVAGLAGAARLVAINDDLRRRISLVAASASSIPPGGMLSGHDATSGGEWTAPLSGNASVLLVPIPRGWSDEERVFWREVALQGAQQLPGLRFAGVCVAGATCPAAPTSEVPFAMLTAMDPLQMRAVRLAADSGLVLLFHGQGLHRALPPGPDARALAAKLLAAIRSASKAAAKVTG